MFDAIITYAASTFNLGDKAKTLVKLLIEEIFKGNPRGFQGFIDRFATAGLGDLAQSWIGGGKGALPIQPDQVAAALGTGTIDSFARTLGLPNAAVTTALAGILPNVIGKLTEGGNIPTSIPTGANSFLNGFSDVAARGANAVANTASSGFGWLKWLIPLALLGLLGYCALNRKSADTVAVTDMATTDATVVADVPAPMPEAASIPDAVVAPAIAAANVYFDVDKSDLPVDTDTSLAEVIAYLKANAGARVSISGFHSPEGDAAHNDELSKKRAVAVRDRLVADGITEDRLDLDKPMVNVGGTVERESRRVEVRIK